MDVLNIEAMYSLMNKIQKPSVSIYLPTFRKGSEAGQNSIRFKNLLKKAEKHLHEKGLDVNKIHEFLAKPLALLDDVDFWNHQLDGLAVFISPSEFQYFKLPGTVEERFIINDHYHLKPLLTYMNGDIVFHILSLDLNTTKLYKCTHFTIEEINLGKTMVRFEDFQKFSEPNTSLENRQGAAPANMPHRDATFHGHGTDVSDSARKKDITEFFRLVDKGVKNQLKESNTLLILAGVEYMVPLYREANSYSNISQESINKNPLSFSLDELREEGWKIASIKNQNKAADALNQFGNLLAYDKASHDVKEVIKAAHSNRILNLLVNFDEEIWGKYDPDNYEVEIHKEKNDGDKELISLAVQQTLYHNGFVYPVNKEKMPNGRPLAAVFRY